MNLAVTLSVYCYGTSEGVRKEWDTRGRKSNWEDLANSKQVIPVYRGMKEGGAPAGFAATFVSMDKDSAAQYGDVTNHMLDLSITKLLSVGDKEARSLVEQYRGEKLSDQDYEDEAPSLFMFPDKDWRAFLTKKGYDGTRIGADIGLFKRGKMWKAA